VAAIAAIIFWGLPALGALVAGGAKPAVVAIMAGLGLTVLTTSATAGSAQCNPLPVPRRGGDKIHDDCANAVPGNEFVGFDVCVAFGGKTKNFDAKSGPVLWEVKTYNMNNQKAPFFIIQKDVADAAGRASPIARSCGYSYQWRLGDVRAVPAIDLVSPGFVPIIADNIQIALEGCIQP
jgi:hypothetical protein